MAAPAAITVPGPNVRQGHTRSTSLTYPPSPGSPTLTNPDMILPDYDYGRAHSPEARSQSPVLVWKDGRTNGLSLLPPDQNPFIAGPATPSTPIIYGNGTMLSDIGEVTEVESVVGRRNRRDSSFLSVNSDDDAALRSSPTMGAAALKAKNRAVSRERRASMESTSTATTQGNGPHFAEFDDVVSVEDLDFQGDDEESMASSYVEGTEAQEPKPSRKTTTGTVSDDHRYSTSSLSDRAEQILANAKRRLTTMEGNLSKARISLYYTPMSDGSTPSPPIRPATAFRETTAPFSPIHSRMNSDSSYRNNDNTNLAPPGFPQRSASALGVAGGYRQPLSSSKSADALGTKHSHRISQHPLDTTLELGESENPLYAENGQQHSRSSTMSSDMYVDKDLTRSASVHQMRDLKDQMNDLKGKISSLREQAKADSMKRRSLQSMRTPSPFTHARWDQGFMEPRRVSGANPETVPWQAPWNKEASANLAEVHTATPQIETTPATELENSEAASINYEDAREPSAEQGVEDAAISSSDDIDPDAQSIYSQDEVQTNVQTSHDEAKARSNVGNSNKKQLAELMGEDMEGDKQRNEEHEQFEEEEEGEDFPDYESESGESLYHDTLQHPVSHEDREDAFDYEHFFLHSAMGTISQQRMGRRNSTSSVGSEDSVETTRGPTLDHARKSSVDTLSSIDSFATATEGRNSRSSALDEEYDDDEDDDDETPDSSTGDSDTAAKSNKRATFGGFEDPPLQKGLGEQQEEQGQLDQQQQQQQQQQQPSQGRRNTVVHRPTGSFGVARHPRPSTASFESTGTTRSFPLVNKPKMAAGVLTPRDSPSSDLEQIAESLMHETASICERESINGDGGSAAVHSLRKEDQALVEGLVASLGRCVLGITESAEGSEEAETHRRRIEMARRILEAVDE